jgi:hypothetical protein
MDNDVKQRITREHAKFVGSNEAQSVMDKTSSTSMLCETLSKSLSEDDRYHFEEFTRYYG